MTPNRRALVLAALQAADLAVTQISPKYGEEHLDHLAVPPAVRPVLPIIKASAVAALLIASRRSRLRPIVGVALVRYYSAAVASHVHAGDSPIDAAAGVRFPRGHARVTSSRRLTSISIALPVDNRRE